jgi:hypothetical protein
VKFLLIHYIDESVLSADADGNEVWGAEEDRALEAWDAEMIARGILVGGNALRPPSQASRTLRVRDGEILVADGPFAETKEQIAGYSILECADLAEATEISARHPTAKIGTFELRQLEE